MSCASLCAKSLSTMSDSCLAPLKISKLFFENEAYIFVTNQLLSS